MNVGSKEFYEVQAQFERDLNAVPGYSSGTLDKETDAPPGYFYKDGRVNQLFNAYMLGYSNAKQLFEK